MRICYVLVLMICASKIATACGIVLPPPERPIREPGFSIRYRRMDASITDGVVKVTAHQAFVNDEPYQREGIYLFPVPEGSVINRMALVIDGKTYEAELLSRDEAVRTYERIVNARRDPALLEFINRQTFRLRVFPFPPHGDREVIVRYDQILRRQGNTYRFVYPVRVERLSEKPIREASITVRIKSHQPIKTVYSPTHLISVRRPDEYTAIISYEASYVRDREDFVLYYSVAEGHFGVTLLPYRNRPDRHGYFLLFLSPKVEWESDKVLPKDIVFVFDRTGSMSGEKIEQAKEALKFCVERLNPNDRFNVIAFNESPDLLWKGLLSATEANKQEAVKFVEGLTAHGGTNINEALLTALPLLTDRDRPRYLMFLTDGMPTVGETRIDLILANIRKANEAKVRLFAFGVGYDVNAVFLDQLANEHGGVSVYVRPNENVEAKVSDLFTMLSEPVLTDVQVKIDGVRAIDIYPQRLPDLFKGMEIVLAGAYIGDGKAKLKVTGKLNGVERSYTVYVSFPERDWENEFVPRIWAARKIGYLLDELTVKGHNPELIDEIVRLSKEFGVLTEFTALLVTEPMIPLAEFRERAEREILSAAEAKSGAWAVAQAVNRQILQRTTAQYDLEMGNQSPMRKLTPSVQAPGGLGKFGGLTASLEGQAIIGRSGEVQKITGIQVVGDRAFAQQDNRWIDLRFDPQKHKVVKIKQFSSAVIQLLKARPDFAKFISLSEEVIITTNDKIALYLGADGKEELSQDDLNSVRM